MPIRVDRARREAKKLGQGQLIDIKTNTNPRGRLAKEAEMSVRRSYLLEAICVEHLQEEGGDPERARTSLPIHGKLKDLLQSDVGKTGLPVAFFRDRELWAWVFDHWLSGALQESREAMTSWLPDENQAAIDKEARRLGIISDRAT